MELTSAEGARTIAAMASTDATILALTALVGFLMNRVKETSAYAETLHVLLVHQGVVLPAVDEMTYAQALKEWDRMTSAAVTEGQGLVREASLQMLLASLKLPEQ